MKKLFALVLAAAMVLSMASVAFAANEKYNLSVDDNPFRIEDHQIYRDVFNYGDTIYLQVQGFDGDEEITSFDNIIKNFKLKADWDKNGDLIESVRFEKVLAEGVSYGSVALYAADDKEIVTVIAIDTKEMPEEVEASDIIGSITIDPKSNGMVTIDGGRVSVMGVADEYGEEKTIDIAFTLDVKPADDINKTEDDNLVYDFEGHEDEEHEIELFAGMGMFTVNTYGQDKLVINTDVKFNEGIENADPDVNYVYFNSNSPAFNRLGSLYLTANEDDVLYKVNKDNSLTKVNAKYDEDEEAFVVRTRVIGSYVIAEGELNDNALSANVEKPAAPVAPVVPANPSTGAAC